MKTRSRIVLLRSLIPQFCVGLAFALSASVFAQFASPAASQQPQPPATVAPQQPLRTESSTTPQATSQSPSAQPSMLRPPGYTTEQGGAAQAPQAQDYRANQASDVFGTQLFTGAFAYQGSSYFNPDYLVAAGDTLQVRLWGAFEFDAQLPVDPQGNIFLPHVGPVQVRGVRNADLQRVVDSAVRRIFRANVNSYASLVAAQPVRVFVGGNVYRPGLYAGTSMDSLLRYLDQAGGIDPERGSFLAVEVRRGNQLRVAVNLYDFLLEGRLPMIQLSDGDVIFVQSRQATIKVNGLAENAKRFEFARASGRNIKVSELIALSKPRAFATHVRVVRNSGNSKNTEYFPIETASGVMLENGDEIEFTADKKQGTISVRVEGEHLSPQEYVLPYGTRLGGLMSQIKLNERSESESVQLFRLSVKERQRQMLATSLRSLEAALLTARSGSSDEAKLRKDEAELTLQWVDRAKKIDPLGQVVIAQTSKRDELLLENGDIVRVPTRDGLVLISGEVLFPNAIAYESGLNLSGYIDRAGGYTQTADNSRIVIARTDGSYEQVDSKKVPESLFVHAGDQVLVLPKVDEKQRQFWKDMMQIIFQTALSAKVVLGL
ncbi:polysaccharide biosynthesis/export family protein [Polaromonas sp. JS666]|uniref:polysaccharide biosynthesis/export family protein n=1 Tax=Polaromonas sp. (strain JS666 / ATCC BAA-500) TaxID=296591 RepID=UPI0000538759|nr:polysaccharide biosynthesis/export family protein [Polaromonas sp. JS666]ABE46812.1 polysaccharide export protein [Polaromonas sp. JS666]